MPTKRLLKCCLLFLILMLFSRKIQAQINPCLQVNSYKIVVLGSSTAAGSGPSSSDSAWVNKYRTYLESIHPNNEVINLAVGGYNTYRIMPTGFIPPVSRPNPDDNRNITAAIAESPDAIIVNMPSNDVGAGYTYGEQMFNLDTIVQIAQNHSIPIWICTTQPRNFSSTTQLQLQSDLKDSINIIFDPFTIDFWSTIANPNHAINPYYDSGDGVHLNDAGHAILKQRVVDADILSSIYTAPSQINYGIEAIAVNLDSDCGDSATIIHVAVANLGNLDSLNSTLYFQTESLPAGYSSIDSIVFTPIPPCQIDTFSFTINSYQQATYFGNAYLQSNNDTIFENDSSAIEFSTLGHPILHPLFDTLCTAGNGELINTLQGQDTSFWYTHASDSIPIFAGSNFQSPFIDTNSTWYVESIRGNLYFDNNLVTTTVSNINWNGAMLNLIPQEDLVLDSIGLKILNTGLQSIDVYYKTGSYLGFENMPNSWTLLTTTAVFVTDSLALTYFSLPTPTFTGNDTIGIYVQLSDPQSRLSYRSVTNSITRSNSELTIITGAGIGHNFTGNYFPRDLNCDIRYHFGNRPQGSCSTGKIPATIFVSDYELHIGNDTIIDIDDSLVFTVPTGLNNWLWNASFSDSMIIVNGSEFGVGIHYISLSGFDNLGCFKTDETTIGIAELVRILEHPDPTIKLFPNPCADYIFSNIEFKKVELFTYDGLLVLSTNQSPIKVEHLPPSVYLVKIIAKDGSESFLQLVKK